jgi:hypothetical protein
LNEIRVQRARSGAKKSSHENLRAQKSKKLEIIQEEIDQAEKGTKMTRNRKAKNKPSEAEHVPKDVK